MRRTSIDTSSCAKPLLKMIAFDSISKKFSHQINSTTANFRSPNSIEDKCFSDLLTTKHANKRLSYEN